MQQCVPFMEKDSQKSLLMIKVIEKLETIAMLQVNTEVQHKDKEVIKVDKKGNGNIATISYKMKSIDSARFRASSLSNLVDNLAEGIHKIKCKDYDCFLEYESVKDNLIKYKCLSCNKDYSNKLDEELKLRFRNTFRFSNNDINKFILLLRIH